MTSRLRKPCLPKLQNGVNSLKIPPDKGVVILYTDFDFTGEGQESSLKSENLEKYPSGFIDSRKEKRIPLF